MPMADPFKLGELIAEHQQILQLQHVAGDSDPVLQPQPGSGFWIGAFTGNRQHRIEVVAPDSLDMFARGLATGHGLPENASSTVRPRIVILSELHGFSGPLSGDLQRYDICAYRSTLPAKPILRELASSLAALGAFESFHAVAVKVFGQGILLCGESGLGKSAIALELLSRGHVLVADDLPTLARMPHSDQVYALCPPMLAELLEVRALGVLDVGKMFGDSASTALCPVSLIIELVEEYTADPDSRLNPFQKSISILDVDIPRVRIPLRHATNPAVMVETLVKNHVLYNAGADASLNLIGRQRQQLEKQTL